MTREENTHTHIWRINLPNSCSSFHLCFVLNEIFIDFNHHTNDEREKEKKRNLWIWYSYPIFKTLYIWIYAYEDDREREREKVKIILQGIYNFKSNYLVHIGIRNEIIDESVNMFDYGENEGMKYLFDMFINDCIRRRFPIGWHCESRHGMVFFLQRFRLTANNDDHR